MVSPPPPEEVVLEMILLPENFKRYDIVVPEGYKLRQFDYQTDTDQFDQLLLSADMGTCRLDYWRNYILPDGFFVIEFLSTKQLVATCFASHKPTQLHPFAGNLGWLAVDPVHRGKKLGNIVVSSVMNRLIAAGYRNIYLGTHPFRLAAIKIYNAMGWIPFIGSIEVMENWKKVYSELNLQVESDKWIYPDKQADY
jgi:ribosomal protein S18 acetylase RimI-like enzyme